jgi:hypothetical protein
MYGLIMLSTKVPKGLPRDCLNYLVGYLGTYLLKDHLDHLVHYLRTYFDQWKYLEAYLKVV